MASKSPGRFSANCHQSLTIDLAIDLHPLSGAPNSSIVSEGTAYCASASWATLESRSPSVAPSCPAGVCKSSAVEIGQQNLFVLRVLVDPAAQLPRSSTMNPFPDCNLERQYPLFSCSLSARPRLGPPAPEAREIAAHGPSSVTRLRQVCDSFAGPPQTAAEFQSCAARGPWRDLTARVMLNPLANICRAPTSRVSPCANRIGRDEPKSRQMTAQSLALAVGSTRQSRLCPAAPFAN